MTTSMFMLTGGAVDRIRNNLTGSSTTDVSGSSESRTPIVWFQCTEVSGTPTLAYGIYNSTTTVYVSLRKAVALTAGQEVRVEQGIMLEKNEYLRIIINGGAVDVVGQTLLGGALDS